MMKNMFRPVLVCIFLSMSAAHASLIVYGDATTKPFGFTSPIVVKAYDRPTGTFFVGIENSTNTPSGAFSLAKASRPSQSKLAQFAGIGSNMLLENETLEHLVIIPAKKEYDVDQIIPYMLGMVIENNSTPFMQTEVTASLNDGSSVVSSIALDDATGATTSGIVQIAANSCFIMPAVLPSTFGSIFGNAGSGLGLVNVQANPLTLTALNATTGMPGNLPVPFNNSISELMGGGPDPVVFSPAPADVNQVAMYYDEVLHRFYIGVRISTGTNLGDIGKAVVVAQINREEGNQIDLFPIVQDSAIDPAADDIIVAEVATQGTNINLGALNLGVMHCSTGPDYLIVNGGEGTTAQTGDLLFAMPLVNNCEDEEFHGTLANANAPLFFTDCKNTYTIPALAMGDLLTADDVRAQIGAGPLPIQPNQSISDMVVVGDAVYASIDIAPQCNANPPLSNDTGIFFSQALFDATGRIASWSPWKRATPFDAFKGIEFAPCLSHDGQVKFFDVDAKTGSVWIVEGTTDELVGYTTWSTGANECDLITQLNELLCSGCYSGLDLNQQTRGFLDETQYRYALFGGANKVVIALVSQACEINNSLSPEEIITNFNCDENIFVDELPDDEVSESCPMGAGCPTVLEYSRRLSTEGDTNYFFAGTENGLYAFSDDGNGFNVSDLGLLDEPPFVTGEWSKIDTISGEVIDIKTSGAKLYVLTQQQSEEQPFINTLYSIEFQDTLDAMFTEGNMNTIAESGVGVDEFENVSAFFAIAIISTGDNDPSKEQLILATSNGLFQSNADQIAGNGIISATNQTEANWETIDGTEAMAFDGIGFMDVPVAYTVWPINVADSSHHFKTFDRSDINQLSGTGNADGTAAQIGTFEPEFFNADSCNCAFNTLYPITYFWSDGGRRFFLINRTTAAAPGAQIALLPYNVDEWNIRKFTPLANATLEQFRSINWVRSIGATGLVIAGTNRGVVGLE